MPSLDGGHCGERAGFLVRVAQSLAAGTARAVARTGWWLMRDRAGPAVAETAAAA